MSRFTEIERPWIDPVYQIGCDRTGCGDWVESDSRKGVELLARAKRWFLSDQLDLCPKHAEGSEP